ncbi:MAG: NADH-quinone oxidoreductase subunit NuoE [Armatimonadetes bacterium]|nr:NADH-quinone oxidoreductase subunit NuoE [Armatimonadota bacterium]MDW8122244.1 NADH-quinone oxidoreductase subunit NuoE [Armatimonadota bacterium]
MEHKEQVDLDESLTFFTDDLREQALSIVRKYPQPKAAVMPLLWLVQNRFGFIPKEAISDLAILTGTTPVHIEAIIKFYELFHDHPVGRYQLMLCTNISCLLNGAEKTLKKLKEVLGVEVGQTTDDGLFTLEEFECLAACDKAPVLLVNCRWLYERVTEDKVAHIVAELRERAKVHSDKDRDPVAGQG